MNPIFPPHIMSPRSLTRKSIKAVKSDSNQRTVTLTAIADASQQEKD
jgi:hypothetical protein